VGGRLLTPYLPHGLLLERSADGFDIYEPSDRAITGLLTLPSVTGGRLNLTDLNVPSNGRFTQQDLLLLWDAGAELSRWKARTALARESGTFGHPDVTGISDQIRDWRSLEQCAHDAAVMIGNWPTNLDRRVAWLPIGVPGGVEDLLVTAQEASERGLLSEETDGNNLTHSARWVGQRRPLHSVTVTAMAWAVIQTVRQTIPSDQMSLIRSVVDPIVTVAQLAGSPNGSPDPDPSSWPIAFINFVTSCTRAIADLQSSSRGTGVLPLLDTDELYEAWLAVETRDALDNCLGSRTNPTRPGSLATWEREDIVYDLWVKPTISRGGRLFGEATFFALVAEFLTPDLMITASRDNETTAHILDAKSWAVLLPEQALEQSAKYLYGIRRSAENLRVPAITGVDLVTCAGARMPPSPELSRVRVTTSTPTKDKSALHLRVRTIADFLAKEIATRERSASDY